MSSQEDDAAQTPGPGEPLRPPNPDTPVQPPARTDAAGTRGQVPRPGTSGWEIADKAASGVGAAARGTAFVILKIYALILLVGGIVVVFSFSQAWWAGLLISAYGLYLILPGSKWVIW